MTGRVVQLSDTHLAATTGVPASVGALVDWLTADPPDLVIHTGDIVWEDPDHEADREFALAALTALPCPVLAIPGNHDVGFFDEPDRRADRVAAFVDAWGADRFAVELPGWRLVGLDVYTVGEPEADGWFAEALAPPGPVALFVHQPLAAEPVDGWQLPDRVVARVGVLLAESGADVRLVASGHRHSSLVRDRPGVGVAGEATHVWAPSTTLRGFEPYHGGDPAPGAVEYRFEPGGTLHHRFVRPSR